MPIPTHDSISVSATQTGRTNRKATASKPLLLTSKSIEEHAAGLDVKTDVNNLNNARKTLTTHGLNLPTAGKTLLTIATALFEYSASSNLGATHSDIIRAFAFIIYEAQKDIDTEHIMEKVKALMGGPVATLDEKVDELEDVLAKYKREMEKTVKEVRDNIQTSIEELVKAAKDTSASVSPHPLTTSDAPGSNGPRSYAAVVKTNVPPLLTKALAKSEAQSRQILIDRRSPLYANSLKDLTEAQLVAKANMAIELITKGNEDSEDTTKKIAFLSARRLPHGGILYELDSAESAQWFSNPANKSKFLEHFGVEVVIKERSFHVLVENIPISFVPDNHAAIDDVEKKAGLKPKTISRARYIKPIARRTPGQRTAHAIFTFSTKEAANQAIKFGLAVAGKKVYGRKLIQEPTRCLKCQSFDGAHVAAECPQEHDTCGTCSGQHRTASCTVTDQNQHRCKNCNMEGHAAWSRVCPTFISKWESYKNRNEDAKYRFFLTDDPLTWETLNDPAQPHEEDMQYRQQAQSRPQHFPSVNRANEGQENSNRRQPPQERNYTNRRNANRIPLGRQTRLTDTWHPQPSQSRPPDQETENGWAAHLGSPYDQYNPESGWDQDHAGNP
jgi:gas vesicle protein